MLFRILVPTLVSCLLISPTIADDQWLKTLMHGPGPVVASSDAGIDPIQHMPTEQPVSVDIPGLDPYQFGEGDDMSFDNPDYLAWYLLGVTGAYRPDGMTDREFADYVQSGCNEAPVCGTVDITPPDEGE